MLSKESALFAVLHRKCPHCHEGEFMVSRNPYDLRHTGDLLDSCPVCHRRYSPEPGFYIGGMYVSYALSVALCITVYILADLLLPNAGDTVHIICVLGSLVILAPVLYTWSKVIWAVLFIPYKGVAPVPGEDPKWVIH